MNVQIRSAIQNYIASNGPADTRKVIELFAKRFRTSKQRISGNISFLVCRAGTLSIINNTPHSILY